MRLSQKQLDDLRFDAECGADIEGVRVTELFVEFDALLAEVERERDEARRLYADLADRCFKQQKRLEQRIATLEAEAGHHDHWHAFGARVWRWLAENWDTEDGWELAEIAVLAGLAEHVKYDPDIHGECEAEPGDDIIYPLRGDPAFAALAGRGAE